MEENKKQVEFSRLYLNLISKNNHQEVDAVKNPFQYLPLYLSNYPTIIEVNDFNKSLKYQRDLSAASDYAFECFQLEFNLLENDKSEYLNRNIDFLFKYYKQSINNNVFITNTIIQLFSKFCQPPHAKYLNSTNRKKLLKWFIVKEPITSFVFKVPREDKWFEQKIKHTLIIGFGKNFISKETSFSAIKALFQGKYLENKIDWIDNKSSLCYFIKSLVASNLIVNPKNKHWEITSEFFLLKGELIKQDELVNQKTTTDIRKRQNINRFFDDLKHYS